MVLNVSTFNHWLLIKYNHPISYDLVIWVTKNLLVDDPNEANEQLKDHNYFINDWDAFFQIHAEKVTYNFL